MGLQFDTPWLLMLLLPLAYLAYGSWKRLLRLKGWRKTTVFAIRCFIVLLLVFVLAGLHWTWSIDQINVTYVVDRSDSVPEHDHLDQWLQAAERERKAEDTSGLVSFGLDAVVERSPDDHPMERLRMNSRINTGFTDLGNAVRLASSTWPNEVPGRMVLITDGNENSGELLREARLLKNRGIALDILHTGWEQKADVAIEELRTPEQMYLGEKYGLEVTVKSNVSTGAVLRVYEGQRELTQQFIEVEQGENRFLIETVAADSGMHRYRAEIYPETDEQSVNNQAFAYSRVSGPPNVLVVGNSEQSETLTEVLTANLIPYELQLPTMLSEQLDNYTKYDSILLNNVSADEMSEQQMTMIEQAVRDFGVGLVAFGGDSSFGLGNYFDTPLEEALPVYMDLRGKREIPSLAMVLVIDRSGSMSGENIRLARESAARTAELLRPQDTLGVIAFDTQPNWVVEPQEIGDNAEDIQDKIRTIDIGGGTDIYPAVEEGFHALQFHEAKRKHMILLTDGHSSTRQNYRSLTEDMAERGITLSTVAVGTEADHALLESLANMANGRYYNAQDEQSLPAIFSRETVMMSRTYIVDEPFVPQFAQAADWHRRLQVGGVPPIWAYIATTPKETAEVALVSPEPDPLLARWRYGAGKAVAWTSDIAGKWSGEWVGWEDFSEVMGEWVKWSFPTFESAPMRIETRQEGTKLHMTAISSEPNFQGSVKAQLYDGDDPEAGKDSHTIAFQPTQPGVFEAEWPITEPGAYLLRMEAESETRDLDGDEASINWTTGFVVPYSPEYTIQTNASGERTMAMLDTAAELTGGRMLSWENPQAVFQERPENAVKRADASFWLLVTCLILWLIDIALRRFSGYRFALHRRRRDKDSNTADHAGKMTNREQTLGNMVSRIRREDKGQSGHHAAKDEKGLPRTNESSKSFRNDQLTSSSSPRSPLAKGENKASGISEEKQEESSDREQKMNRLLQAKKRRQ